jgi:hypothetical protein
MNLYIETMDAFLVEFAPDGRVRLDNEAWISPSVQERRAIIHAAEEAVETLLDVVESPVLEAGILDFSPDGDPIERPMAVSKEEQEGMLDAARAELAQIRELLQILEKP